MNIGKISNLKLRIKIKYYKIKISFYYKFNVVVQYICDKKEEKKKGF